MRFDTIPDSSMRVYDGPFYGIRLLAASPDSSCVVDRMALPTNVLPAYQAPAGNPFRQIVVVGPITLALADSEYERISDLSSSPNTAGVVPVMVVDPTTGTIQNNANLINLPNYSGANGGVFGPVALAVAPQAVDLRGNPPAPFTFATDMNPMPRPVLGQYGLDPVSGLIAPRLFGGPPPIGSGPPGLIGAWIRWRITSTVAIAAQYNFEIWGVGANSEAFQIMAANVPAGTAAGVYIIDFAWGGPNPNPLNPPGIPGATYYTYNAIQGVGLPVAIGFAADTVPVGMSGTITLDWLQ